MFNCIHGLLSLIYDLLTFVTENLMVYFKVSSSLLLKSLPNMYEGKQKNI